MNWQGFSVPMDSPGTRGPGYKLIVFDWDGTIADSLHHIVTAMKAAAVSVHLPPGTSEEILGVIGLGLNEAVAALYPKLEADSRNGMVESYRQHYLLAATGNTVLYPDARATLARLHSCGYLLAVATGKSRRGLERAITDTDVKRYFHASRCADETFSKPHPQMLLEIMDILEVTPEQTLMVGDSEHDMQMAANAGVSSIAIGHGARPLRRLLEFRPLAGLQCLNELPGWLEAQ
jgi:phosphoglycolate phosphatase